MEHSGSGDRDPRGLAAVSHPIQDNSKWLCGIHCVPHPSFYVIQTKIFEVGTVNSPITQMSKLRQERLGNLPKITQVELSNRWSSSTVQLPKSYVKAHFVNFL